jgi:hypothetical protein
MTTILGLIFIIVLARFIPKILRIMIFGSKRKSKGIISKLFMLLTREIHHKLNKVLKKQVERFQVENSDKVIPLKKQKAT